MVRGCKQNITDFYINLEEDKGWAITPGQFFYAHVVYPYDFPQILKMIEYNPVNEKTRFQIKPYSEGDEKHYPVIELKLRNDELLYVHRGKKRLIVNLGYVETGWMEEIRMQKILLCAPVFSFKKEHSQEMILEVQRFDYPNYFYLPPDAYGCPEESAVRFEFIQPISKGWLNPLFTELTPKKPVCLSKEAYMLLMNHFVKFISGKTLDKETDDLVEIYRELLLEEIEKSKRDSLKA